MLSSQVTNDDLKCKAVWQGPSWNNDGRLLPPMDDRKTLHVCVYLQAHEEILQIQLLSGVPSKGLPSNFSLETGRLRLGSGHYLVQNQYMMIRVSGWVRASRESRVRLQALAGMQ